MKTQKPPLRDFFADYNNAKIRTTVLSTMFAVLLSLSAVMVTQWVDPRGLMASVSNVANQKVYPADLVLESWENGKIDIVYGSTAQAVDTITFTLLSDPEKLTSLSASDIRTTIVSKDPGMYEINLRLAHENIYPGTKLITLETNAPSETSIAIVDTSFDSAGMKYSLTSKGR